MDNKQQTAVEWFIEQLNSKYGGNDFLITHINEIEKAKEMEKQIMIEFADNYVDNCVIPNDNMAIPTIMDVPNYYNETYGGGEQ
jgi:disulfide oxidoreductase YuzD